MDLDVSLFLDLRPLKALSHDPSFTHSHPNTLMVGAALRGAHLPITTVSPHTHSAYESNLEFGVSPIDMD